MGLVFVSPLMGETLLTFLPLWDWLTLFLADLFAPYGQGSVRSSSTEVRGVGGSAGNWGRECIWSEGW